MEKSLSPILWNTFHDFAIFVFGDQEVAGLLSRRKFIAGTAGICAAPAVAQQKPRFNEIAEFGPQPSGETQLLDPTAPFVSAVGQPGWRGRAPDDLVARARLALEGTLTSHVRDNGLPYFDVVINYATGEVDLPAKITTWDHTSQTGRSVNAILCAREMTGDWKTGVENERKIRRVMIDDFREDGFNDMANGVAMMHDQNRVLLGLTNWYLHAEDERERQKLKGYGDKLVAAFMRTGFCKQGEAWDMPGMYYSPEKGFYDPARAPGKHGRTIMPLIEYGRTTGNSDAIKLAERYARHVLEISDLFRFDEAGNFKDFGNEALHVHSVGATISGLILLGTELGRRDLVEQGRALYENGLSGSETNSAGFRNRTRTLRSVAAGACCVRRLAKGAASPTISKPPFIWLALDIRNTWRRGRTLRSESSVRESNDNGIVGEKQGIGRHATPGSGEFLGAQLAEPAVRSISCFRPHRMLQRGYGESLASSLEACAGGDAELGFGQPAVRS